MPGYTDKFSNRFIAKVEDGDTGILNCGVLRSHHNRQPTTTLHSPHEFRCTCTLILGVVARAPDDAFAMGLNSVEEERSAQSRYYSEFELASKVLSSALLASALSCRWFQAVMDSLFGHSCASLGIGRGYSVGRADGWSMRAV